MQTWLMSVDDDDEGERNDHNNIIVLQFGERVWAGFASQDSETCLGFSVL